MFATSADTNTILQLAIRKEEYLPEPLSKTFLKTGYALSAE